ncbi:MAG: glycosyltransferase family 4 protein [Aeromicrobium sp.]|nr:glycosyltransferase family 4 protein [Burkholderiales bacterium]
MRVVLFANTDWYLYNFRLPLAQSLRARGEDVVLVSPSGAYGEKLRALGFTWYAFDFARKGTNPVAELRTLNKLTDLYRMIAPDLAHHFTIKCVLYGGIAAARLGIPTVSAVTGMGHVFTTNTIKTAVLRPALTLAYRYALRKSQVIFQNPDDLKEFQRRRLVATAATHLIRGSGVNTSRFVPLANALPPPVTVLMVGRLLREKGVVELVEAARLLKSTHPSLRIQIAGSADEGNPSSFSETEVSRWASEGAVEFLGHRDDVQLLLGAAHIAALPSYREGTPRSLLEAAACGLPIIATNVPGCREICRDGDNGILVPAKDSSALAAAIATLADDPALRAKMGKRSREIAEHEFSEEKVIRETLAIYAAALATAPVSSA